ncbi:hypothetical protein [Bosea sp. (in: a-proteobacteria)]|uniref:hypothetical protein n=1 Tax=Bosea sp. (in: a-proteobacteria) TaxID=1871050 RepID=UPI001AC116EC|nr:hypothetical protein [Bosea sp. (in: a-proteobacteria)]MBN9443839.1 hypothetical protein [Bosea sp. (in: a-proteobacteria)]
MMRALACLQALVEKGGFNPEQPRVPAGSPEGGQWTNGEGGGQSRQPGIGDNGGPTLDPPKDPSADRSSKIKAAKALAKAIARQALRRAGPIGAVVTAIEAAHWLYTEWPSIRSYQDAPKSFSELQEQAGKKRPGYDDHHIVEQGAESREGFPRADIDGAGNIVSIPRYKHHEITGWYATRNAEFGNLSPRDYLRGRGWGEHMKVGRDALRRFKVPK